MLDTLNLGEEIIAGTKDVFSTMLMIDLEDGPVFINQECNIKSNLTSIIGLGGDICGMLAIHASADAAKAITGGFLGMEIESLDDDVKDAIGEIANMVAGNLKAACSSHGKKIELAIPTTIVGESFSVLGQKEAERVVVPLKMNDQSFWVELTYVSIS